MKKLFLSLLIVIFIFTTSCNPQPTPEEGESYTIMFYAVGGGSLDMPIIDNIYDAMQAKTASNINMTFQVKLSEYLQHVDSGNLQNFDGVRRFSKADQKDFDSYDTDYSNKFPGNLVSERAFDANYDMGSAEALADFIRWSAAKHPADHYMLILSDHGNGWNITIDGSISAGETRKPLKAPQALLFDDNIGDMCMTIKDCTEGIKQSGMHIESLYMDACLMSMAENIYPLIGVVDYFIGSLESVPGKGGAYQYMLEAINSNSGNFMQAMSTYCDYCVSDSWWAKSIVNDTQVSADIAIYDLNKIMPAFEAIHDFAHLMQECLEDTSSYINPNNGIKQKYADFAYTATTRAEMAVASNTNMIECCLFLSTDILPQSWGDTCSYFAMPDFLAAITEPGFIEAVLTFNSKEDLLQQINYILRYSNYAISIADYMKLMGEEAAIIGDERFNDLYNRYIVAIKNATHIAGTFATETKDGPYHDASMGVNLMSLSEKGCHYFGYNEIFLFQGNRYAENHSREELLRWYQSSSFDQFTSWSEIMQRIDINPSYFTNRSRYENLKE